VGIARAAEGFSIFDIFAPWSGLDSVDRC